MQPITLYIIAGGLTIAAAALLIRLYFLLRHTRRLQQTRWLTPAEIDALIVAERALEAQEGAYRKKRLAVVEWFRPRLSKSEVPPSEIDRAVDSLCAVVFSESVMLAAGPLDSLTTSQDLDPLTVLRSLELLGEFFHDQPGPDTTQWLILLRDSAALSLADAASSHGPDADADAPLELYAQAQRLLALITDWIEIALKRIAMTATTVRNAREGHSGGIALAG